MQSGSPQVRVIGENMRAWRNKVRGKREKVGVKREKMSARREKVLVIREKVRVIREKVRARRGKASVKARGRCSGKHRIAHYVCTRTTRGMHGRT